MPKKRLQKLILRTKSMIILYKLKIQYRDCYFIKQNYFIGIVANIMKVNCLQEKFKNDVFYAYKNNHLDYLKLYVSATLREHKDRIGFTLLEKLPKFMTKVKQGRAIKN